MTTLKGRVKEARGEMLEAQDAEDEKEDDAVEAANDAVADTADAKAAKKAGNEEEKDNVENDDDDDEMSKVAAGSMAADPVTVATYCAEQGFPALTAELIKTGATLADVQSRIAAAAAIRGIFADASTIQPAIDATIADTLIKSGASADDAREIVGKLLVSMQSEDIGTAKPEAAGQENHGWEDAIAKAVPAYVFERAKAH
jgi:hypothetical protein